MRRREFIRLLSTIVAWPLAAHAQQTAMPVIGYLNGGSAKAFQSLIAAFRQGLSDTGYVEGQNLAIEYRWADGDYEKLPRLAIDLVGRPVSVIVANGPPAVIAAKAATATIPIVFETAGDPGSAWTGYQPCTTGRQSHRCNVVERGGRRKVVGAVARAGA